MVLQASKDLKAAKRLYFQAFPRHERLPWWVLRLSGLQKGVALTAYYEEGEFCGFTHTTVTEDVVYVMFLAVAADMRGRGYGSGILTWLKEHHRGKTIILNVEPLDEQADNAAERVQRMAFYRKNGFYDTHCDIREVGGVFRVLATRPTLDTQAYWKAFAQLTFGLWKPKITKGER